MRACTLVVSPDTVRRAHGREGTRSSAIRPVAPSRLQRRAGLIVGTRRGWFVPGAAMALHIPASTAARQVRQPRTGALQGALQRSHRQGSSPAYQLNRTLQIGSAVSSMECLISSARLGPLPVHPAPIRRPWWLQGELRPTVGYFRTPGQGCCGWWCAIGFSA